MAEELKNLQDLLVHELEDLYSAEKQIIDGLPKMIENATDPELKKSLNTHLKVTRRQKDRLDKVKKLLGMKSNKDRGLFARLFTTEGPEHCKAMEGLIKEGEKMMGEPMDPEVMDAAIIAAAQKIEHYEISSYGTARAFAVQLGLTQVVKLLEQTLNEEYEADILLTDLAINKVNLEAEDDSVKGLRKVGTKKAPTKTARKATRKKARR